MKTPYKGRSVFIKALAVAIVITTPALSQQVYDDFEGIRLLHYGERFGVLDTNAANPAPGGVNNSKKCALYVRNGSKKFANIKMNLSARPGGVETYATHEGKPPQLKLKVYTSAPAGTLVELLLGARRGNNDYPAGTHSQYQAYTTKSNEWEELEFKFSQIPQGSETSASEIDQVVLLFNPNTLNSDTYYFDELTGPGMQLNNITSPPAEKDSKKTKRKDAGKSGDAGSGTTEIQVKSAGN